MSKKIIFILFAYCFSNSSLGNFESDVVNFAYGIRDQLEDSWGSIINGETLEKAGEMGGYISDNYNYSYVIWNNSHIPIYSSQQSITSFMGADLSNADGMRSSSMISSWLNPSPAITIAPTVTLTSQVDPNAVTIVGEDSDDDDNTSSTDDASSADDSTDTATSDVTVDGDSTSTSAPIIDYINPSFWADVPATLTAMQQKIYFDLYISKTADVKTDPLYLDSIQTLGFKNSGRVYHYNAYTTRKWSGGSQIHVPGVELMGFTQAEGGPVEDTVAGTVSISNQLSSMTFFNNTADDVKMSLTYNSVPLMVTLEKYSFNMITVPDESQTLRPNQFSFYEVGSAEPFVITDFPAIGFEGRTYTLEVYQDKGATSKAVGLQGLSSGKYDLPISNKVRDISPIACNLWWQNIEQAGSPDGYIDLLGQLWVVYDNVDTPIMSKVIRAGGAISWNMLRPKPSKGFQYLYFLYLETKSDEKAHAFISEFIGGDIGNKIKSMYKNGGDENASINASEMISFLNSTDSESVDSLSNDNKVEILTGDLDYTLGSMIDAAGTTGYLVGADYFASTGLGNATQNYIFPPSTCNVSTLLAIFQNYITNINLESKIQQWINSYAYSLDKEGSSKEADQESIRSEIEALIISSNVGATELTNSPYVSNGALTSDGINALNSLMTGPISIKNPSIPMQMATVYNQYPQTMSSEVPDGIKSSEAVESTPIPLYTPPATNNNATATI